MREGLRTNLGSSGAPTGIAVGAPAPFGVVRRYERGAQIVVAGQPAGLVYWVRAGLVRTYLIAESGEETTTAVLVPGMAFGLEALLGAELYYAFAEALDDVEVWAAPADELREHVLDDAWLYREVATALCRRLTHTEALLVDVAVRPVAARIPRALQRLKAGGLGGRSGLTRQALAALVGARRETVSRASARCEG